MDVWMFDGNHIGVAGGQTDLHLHDDIVYLILA